MESTYARLHDDADVCFCFKRKKKKTPSRDEVLLRMDELIHKLYIKALHLKHKEDKANTAAVEAAEKNDMISARAFLREKKIFETERAKLLGFHTQLIQIHVTIRQIDDQTLVVDAMKNARNELQTTSQDLDSITELMDSISEQCKTVESVGEALAAPILPIYIEEEEEEEDKEEIVPISIPETFQKKEKKHERPHVRE